MGELRKAAEALAHWPGSTCVECGRKMPSGRQQKCNSSMGGVCNWHIPGALRQQMYKLAAALAEPQGIVSTASPIPFEDWWASQGRSIDPDTEDVPWFDKRKGLAEAAYDAGQSSVRFAAHYPPAQPEQPQGEPEQSLVERDAQWEKAIDEDWMMVLEGHVNLHDFLRRVRARLLPARGDAAERVNWCANDVGHIFKVDGKERFRTIGTFVKDAERIAAALRKELADAR